MFRTTVDISSSLLDIRTEKITEKNHKTYIAGAGRKSLLFLRFSEPPPLISGEQKSNGGLVHPHLKGFDEPKQVSDTRLLEGLLTVLSFTLFSPGHAVRFPKLSARQRLKPMPIGR